MKFRVLLYAKIICKIWNYNFILYMFILYMYVHEFFSYFFANYTLAI